MSEPKRRVHKNGDVSYHVVVNVGIDPTTGKRVQRRITARTKRACKDAALAELAKIRGGEYVAPSNQTVAAFLTHWLEGLGPPLRPSTVSSYAVAVARILPRLGAVKLADVGPYHIRRLRQSLEEAGYAANTIRATHVVLHKALDQAVAWRVVARNPAAGTKQPPSTATRVAQVWSAAEARRFAASVAGHRYGAVWLLVLDTGLRMGEALALRWGDVDLEAAVLVVRRTLTTDAARRWVVGDAPKSRAGRRTVSLSAETVGLLRLVRGDGEPAAPGEDEFGHAEAGGATDGNLGPVGGGSAVDVGAERLAAMRTCDVGQVGLVHTRSFVFHRVDGSFLVPETVARAFRAACRAAGVPVITPHGMRHCHATFGLAAGINPRVMADRLGHSSTAITLDLYSHVSESLQHEAAQRIRGHVEGIGALSVREREGLPAAGARVDDERGLPRLLEVVEDGAVPQQAADDAVQHGCFSVVGNNKVTLDGEAGEKTA